MGFLSKKIQEKMSSANKNSQKESSSQGVDLLNQSINEKTQEQDVKKINSDQKVVDEFNQTAPLPKSQQITEDLQKRRHEK